MNKEEKIEKIKDLIEYLEYYKVDVTKEKETFAKILEEKETVYSSTIVVETGEAVLSQAHSRLHISESKLTDLLRDLELLKLTLLTRDISEYISNPLTSLEEKVKYSQDTLKIIKYNNASITSETIDNIYQIIYEVIKEELANNLNSEILNTLTNFDKRHINRIIRQNIHAIKTSSYAENIEYVKELLDEERKMRLNGNDDYVNTNILYRIIKCENSKELTVTTNGKLNKIKTELDSKKSELEKRIDVNHPNRSLEKMKEMIKSLNAEYKIIKRRIVAGAITTSLILGVGIGGTQLLKKMISKDYFETTKTTIMYDEEMREPQIEKYYETFIKEQDRLILEIYGPIYTDVKTFGAQTITDLVRDYHKYSLEKVIGETDLEYLMLSPESEGIIEKSRNSSAKDYIEGYYEGEIKKLTRITQSDTPAYSVHSVGFHIFLCITLYITLLVPNFKVESFPLKSIIEIEKSLKNMKKSKKEYTQENEYLEEYIEKYIEIIESSEELTNKFNELIKNGIITQDTEQMAKEIESLINEINKNEKYVEYIQSEKNNLTLKPTK